ncbi:MAG: RagB/SusD family nutrient uptake outer membrane protein [Tannerellaceae bacterium]|jgi:hypothetical protein|nr:RagB/SusD family nutrient uptake outer membrane protein [Tannerellaceae bacterium]
MRNLSFFSLLLSAAAVFAGCEKEETAIKVQDSESLTQDVFAEETQGKSGVTFTAASAWTSSITEASTTRAGSPAWIFIHPDHGDEAGDYTIFISLQPNLTGADRAAVVHIVCDDTEIAVNVTQKAEKADGTLPSVTPEEIIRMPEQLYGQVRAAWLEIDREYSTQASRQSLTPDSPFLLDFWRKSYDCIRYCNLLIDQLADIRLPEADKTMLRGSAIAYRATVYFYLNTLFGGTPLFTSYRELVNDLPRATVEEINVFIRSALEEAIGMLPAQAADSLRLMLSVHSLQGSDFYHALSLLEGIRQGGLEDFDPLSFAQCLLLSAEAYVQVGNIAKALESLNVVNARHGWAILLQGTPDEVSTAIRYFFGLWNEGLQFLNAVRWGQTESWAIHMRLLPIPTKVIEENPYIAQNPGW